MRWKILRGGIMEIREMNEILAMENAAMERWRQGDPMAWTEISAEEVTYFDQNLSKPIIGLPDYVDYLKQAIGQIYYKVSEFIDPVVRVYDDLAVLTYNYRSTIDPDSTSSDNQKLWNTTEVYIRKNDKWQIIHTHWSYVQHRLPADLEIPLPIQMEPKQFTGVLGEIMALELSAMKRWRMGDPWGFYDLYVPEVTYFDTQTTSRINGKEAMRQEYALREGKIHYDVMDFIHPHAQVHGNSVVLSYRFLSTVLNQDGSIASRTPWNCSEVYVRVDGSWRIVHNHWSFIRGERSL